MLLCLSLTLGANFSRSADTAKDAKSPEQYRYRVVQTLKHSRQSFTQGLHIEGDLLWESSGLYGRSFLQLRHKHSPPPKLEFRYPAEHFAEGIAVHGDYLYGLTWKSGTVYRWHKHNLQLDKRFVITGQGWGLARWKQELVTSDGSDILSFRDPETLRTTRRIAVTLNSRPVRQLNDLSADESHLWANVWHQNRLLYIDPSDGQVIAILNLEQLANINQRGKFEHVLNGVAWDSSSNTLWVTGKHWPNMYQLKIEREQS